MRMTCIALLPCLFIATVCSIARVIAATTTTSGGPVCGLDRVTYPTPEAASNAQTEVLNCGPCGACSNQRDLEVYIRTASNLTAVVRACGLMPLRTWQEKCLLRIGFTPGCASCFLANIDCDRHHCLRPCLTAWLVSSLSKMWAWVRGRHYEPPPQSLASSECLACDEERCGPAFLACAGANRRRSGIVSDITRDEAEVCKVAVAAHCRAGEGGGGARAG